MFERGDLAAAGGLSQAWLAKARLQLQQNDESAALETATQALKYLMKPQQQQSAASADMDALTELRAIVGLCLLSKGQIDRAVAALTLIAGEQP